MDARDIANGRLIEADFVSHGFQCVVTFADASLFCRCGYVVLPKGHPYSDGKSDHLIPCHGGVTYSKPTPDGGRVIGFDFAHHGDYPDVEYAESVLDPDDFMEFMRYASACACFGEEHTWTVDEVMAECAYVAEYLEEVAGNEQ